MYKTQTRSKFRLFFRINLAMRAVLLLLIYAVYAVSAVPVPGDVQKHYPRFIELRDGEGNMHLVDLEAQPDMELLQAIQRNPNNEYILFTRKNPEVYEQLIMGDADSILSSNFNPDVPTVVIAHGWLSNQNSDLNPVIRDAYLAKSDCNVIVLDWRRLAISDYVTAVSGVPAIGRGLGQFLAFLNSITGAPFSSMHLVGFSLGAHVVGNAGRELDGKIARVTGLDPSGVLWTLNSNRLGSDDAIYVEAIHTDGGVDSLGIGIPIADVDFFPNGGISQPGCITSLCDHNRAWELFAATITYNHLIGRECSTMLQVTINFCRGGSLPMGNDVLDKKGSGMYRVDTGWRYPF